MTVNQLTYRKAGTGDEERVRSVFSNEATMRYAYMNRITDPEAFREFFTHLCEENEKTDGRWIFWLVFEHDPAVDLQESVEDSLSGRFLGIAELDVTRFAPEALTAEIGYFLLPEAWGRGIGAQVAEWLIRVAIEDLGAAKVNASCNAENQASERIMQKCGMQCEGVMRAQRYKDRRWVDELRYGLLSSEWMERKQGGSTCQS